MRTWNGAVPAAHAQFEAKRQALLREAASCFTRKGYHGTSLTEIADTLGVSKAALYTYVKSKDELLYFCHQAALDVAFDAITRAQSREGSGLQKLCTGLENYLRAMLSDQTSYVLILEEHALLPEHAQVILERRDQFEAALRGLVVEGMADGSMVPCNPKLAIFATLGIVNWVMKWYAAGGPWTGDQIATEMVRYVERMLSGQPAPLLGILPMPGDPLPAAGA